MAGFCRWRGDIQQRRDFNHDVDTLLLQSHVLYKAAKDLKVQHGKVTARKKKNDKEKLEKSKRKYHISLGDCREALASVQKILPATPHWEHFKKHKRVQRSPSLPRLDKFNDITRPEIPENLPSICENCLDKNIIVENHMQEIQTANEKLKQKRSRIKQQVKTLRQVCQEKDAFQQLYKERVSMCELLKQKYRVEKDAKEDALRRLDKLASSKRPDNNPNIADLSDKNRPTKIAEMMSDLYNTQWTDAYELLEKQQMEERDIIQKLKDILMAVNHVCSRLASDNFFERVQKAIELPVEVPERQTAHVEVVLPDLLKQQVKEFRKSRAQTVLKDIELILMEECVTANKQLEELRPYISSCIEISWLGAVQDPPLILKSQAPVEFDASAFKNYTRKGKFTEFVVWPALYLHDCGPLLSMGVAQGCDDVQLTSET